MGFDSVAVANEDIFVKFGTQTDIAIQGLLRPKSLFGKIQDGGDFEFDKIWHADADDDQKATIEIGSKIPTWRLLDRYPQNAFLVFDVFVYKRSLHATHRCDRVHYQPPLYTAALCCRIVGLSENWPISIASHKYSAPT